MLNLKTLSARMKAYRKEHHMNQDEFAAKVGMSRDTISLIERENANPTLNSMEGIASYMGITVWELLKPEEEV